MNPPADTQAHCDSEDLWARDPVTGDFRGSPVGYLNELEAAILAQAPGPLRAARAFFFELDRQAEAALAPVTLSPAELAAHRSALNGALGGLMRRFESRFRGAGVPAPVPGALRLDISHFSALIRRLARVSFPTSKEAEPCGVDLTAWGRAFERFANGELRLFLPGAGVWTTQPSSGFYFYFAELGFAALELGLDGELWAPLLPTLVATQRIFADLYAPDSAARARADLADYHPRWFRPERRWSEARKAALRSEFASHSLLDLDRIASEHARRTFPAHARLAADHLPAAADAS